jgi:hypothetical protein
MTPACPNAPTPTVKSALAAIVSSIESPATTDHLYEDV